MESLSFDQILAISLLLLALLIGLGATVAMDAKTNGEFRTAVTCFIISALMLVYVVGAWDMKTERLFYTRGLICIGAFAVITGVGL